MGVKYVKDFDFPAEGGFHKSSMPSRAMPNAPARGAAKMESKPKMGKGQGYAKGGKVQKLAGGGSPYYSGGPQSRVPTGPTSPRVTYIPNPFGKAIRVPIGPSGASMPRVSTTNQFTWSGEENPNFNRALAEAEDERRQQTIERARGGKVSKVMREYKAGKLHSGSKKGPVVKSQKQAVAIALSEARKAGAKIPKKAEGGMMDSYGDKTEPYRGSPKKAKMLGRQDRRAREAMERAEKYAPGKSVDMPDRKSHGGMPMRRKAMYGGGKC